MPDTIPPSEDGPNIIGETVRRRVRSNDSSSPSDGISGPHTPTITRDDSDPTHPWFRWDCSCGVGCSGSAWNNERTALQQYEQRHWKPAMAREVAALRAANDTLLQHKRETRDDRDAWCLRATAAEAEVERMRPVVEAARRDVKAWALLNQMWHDNEREIRYERQASVAQECQDKLRQAMEAHDAAR
jgi:hypothetical protein